MTKPIKKQAIGFALPQEHYQMIAAIKKLPDVSLAPILWNEFQGDYLKACQERWRRIGLRLDYLQKVQMGFRPPDPLEKGDLYPQHRQSLDVISRYKFAMLNLMNAGFDTIRDVARSESRNFPFHDPRELFTEMCSQEANSIEKIANKEFEQNSTLNEDREYRVFLNAFYRDRLEPETSNQFLNELKTSPLWDYFCIYALWNLRYKTPLKRYWQDFLKSYKELIRLYSDTKYHDGAKLCKIKWNSGHAVVSETGKPAKYATNPQSLQNIS